MINIKIFILIFISFHYVISFSNMNKTIKIKENKINIFESGEYIINRNSENISIIINTNYVTIYIIDSHLNAGFNPLIMVNENIKNITLYLNESVLSSSYDSGIIQLKKNSSIIVNAKFSIIKGGKIIIGEKKSNLTINGLIGLSDKIKYINMKTNIDEDFVFFCENEKIKFDSIYLEITSNSILKQNDLCIQNPSPFKKNRNEKSSQIYNKEVNFHIIIQNLFEKEYKNEENNTFFLNYLYFKHLNIAKEKSEEKILKKSNIFFKPKVSVIIPIYNVEKYLTSCLNSIVNQTLKEIEIICVNDGSIDDSLLILLNYSKNDDRIVIIDQRNRGLSEARNTGVKFSNGEFIYFIDSDDLLKQNALFELYEYGTKNNLDIIFFKFLRFKNRLNLEIIKDENVNNTNYFLKPENIMEGQNLLIELKKNKHLTSSACIIFLRKQFYIDAGLSFYPGILHEDELFYINAIFLANRTTFIKKIYYYYRMHKKSIIHKKKNIKYLYGYLISYCEMINKLNNITFKKNIIDVMNIKKKYLIKSMKKIMKTISKKEKKILSLILTDNQKNQLSSIIRKQFN